MQKKANRHFPDEEFNRRRGNVRKVMAQKGLDAILVSSPENVYYLTGLIHQGYFAYEMLVFPLEGEPALITRAMEAPMVADLVPDARHFGYSDGAEPLPPPTKRDTDLVMASPTDSGRVLGLEPWSASLGVSSRSAPESAKQTLEETVSPAVRVTCDVLNELGLARKRVAFEKNSSFLPYNIADRIVRKMQGIEWQDGSGVVDDCRVVQSELELRCTRQAAAIADSMMLAGIATAGPGVRKSDIMAAIYDTLFRRGGTYPGFVPLVRSTRTLAHEHGTWEEGALRKQDILFLELAGCVWRYHAPLGRIVFMDKAPARAEFLSKLCADSMAAIVETIKPGIKAKEVYRRWQECLDRAGLSHYRRHHCGYTVGIGFPPSWSGSGVPVGLRADSEMELRSGMVFHLMSWLLRTGQGDSFLSDTAVVTENGCEVLTTVSRNVMVVR